MKLYSVVVNERGSSVQKGSHKALSIRLSHETAYGSWETLPSQINLIQIEMRWNNGKPTLTLYLPKTWEFRKHPNLDANAILAEYEPSKDKFTYPDSK